MSEIEAEFDRHKVECPHCQREIEHFWPGKIILFAGAKCSQCGQEFLIVQNEATL